MTHPILVVLPSIVTAGAEIQAMLQIRELVRRGIPVRLLVLTGTVDRELLAQSGLADAETCILRNPSSILGPAFLKAVWRDLPRATAFAASANAGTAVAHLAPAHFFTRLLFLSLLLRGRRVRLVQYHHSEERRMGGPLSLGKRLYFSLDRLLGWIGDRSHLHVSDRVRAHVAGHCFTRRNAVLHNTCDMDSPGDPERARAILSPHAGRWVVLLPGRLVVAKGHLGFLRALRCLIDREELTTGDVHVLLAGGGPLRPEIETAIEAQALGGYVTLLGETPHPVLLALYGMVDLVAVPSLSEGFGIVVIEAMARGALVAASNAAGLQEIVRPGVNGLQFPAGDETALCQLLREVWRRRGEAIIDPDAAAADVRARFGLAEHVDRLLALIGR